MKCFVFIIISTWPVLNRYWRSQEDLGNTSFKKQFFNDVKMRINETSKYVLPEEGTTNYSLMYVPAESIFLTILEDYDMIRYSMNKFVLLCSPVTFYYIMHAINETIKKNSQFFNIYIFHSILIGLTDRHVLLRE